MKGFHYFIGLQIRYNFNTKSLNENANQILLEGIETGFFFVINFNLLNKKLLFK